MADEDANGAITLERALAIAYRALNARDRTVAELRSLVERRGASAQQLDDVVVECENAGLLDDERYARRFAEDKRELDRWGGGRIEQTLLRRGIAADVAAAAAGVERETELDAALSLLEERIAPPSDDRQRQRAWALLVRRGYEPELAYEAVRTHAG